MTDIASQDTGEKEMSKLAKITNLLHIITSCITTLSHYMIAVVGTHSKSSSLRMLHSRRGLDQSDIIGYEANYKMKHQSVKP